MLSDSETSQNRSSGIDTPSSERSSPPPLLHNKSCTNDNGVLEPIAIIGMSCRLPGSAQDPSSLWDMLISGRSAWTPGPGKRFNMKAFHDPSGKSGTTYTSGAHFLKEDISAFDADFFGINPVEAMVSNLDSDPSSSPYRGAKVRDINEYLNQAMDPQHRLLLEVAYESFQNAGLSRDSLWGSNTGVYVGQWASDYHEIQTRDVDSPPLHLVTGTGPAMSSNRISYYFNLRGPSFTVDTGCSASTVALHQAIQSLRCGETSQCFVGGVNLILDPQRLVYQCRLKMFSKEGRSFSFDSRANGYGRGEGCTGVMLKTLSAALRDGNHIRAVIRNSVINQDGKTPGIAVPSAMAQKEAIIKAYQQSGLDIHADYVEAHGTGTKVGDPIEARAISEAFSQGRTPNCKLPIGSIKGNIGHTEATAGLAGLIKAVLMLEHGIIPPQINYQTTNPDIRLDEWKLRIPTKLEKHILRRISVNSFGYGGTNAHVIVDATTEVLSSLPHIPLYNQIQSLHLAQEVPRVFFLSAFNERSCQRMCSRLAKYLVLKHHGSRDANGVLERLAYTLGKQSAHAHRLALVSSNLDNLVDQLIMASQSPVPSRSKKGQSRIAFVFSGQGAQYAEMGRQLFKSYPSFIRSIERARQRLIELGCHWDLLSELCRPKKESRINEPAISQPLSTAIQLALVDLLFEFNISPCAVAGHSSGEIAAAYAAEIISFEDAMAVSYFRGKFTDKLITGNPESKGAMLAVGADPTAAEEHINRIDHKYGRMRIACFNSPSSVTVSGDFTAIDQLKAVLDVDGVFNRKLVTNGAAYHSHQMKPMKKEYAAALETFTNTQDIVSSSIRMFSTVTGKEIDKGTVINGDYWVKNLLNPVLFSHAIQNLCEQEYGDQRLDMIIEVGPHSQLGGPVNQILKSLGEGDQGKISYASTLKRGRDAEISLLECMSAIQVQSASLNIHELNREMKGYPPSLLVDLPPYPFDHERTFWHETRVSKDYRHRQHPSHELLGTPSPDMNRLEPRWRRLLSLKDSPWLRGHVVQGQIVFPAAGFLTMATQAVRQHMEMTNPTVRVESILFRNISICKALVLSEDGPDVDISLSLRPEARTARESSNIWNEFRIFSVTPDNKWTEHCRGLVHAETCKVDANDVISNLEDLSRIDTECPQNISHQKAYHRSRACGLDWQHPFDNISKFRTSQSACVSTVRNPITDANLGGMVDVLHPATLDSCLFHGTCMNLILEKGIGSAVVPTFIKQLRIFNQPLMSTSELVSTSTICQEALTFDVVIQDTASAGPNIIVEAQGVHLLKLPGDVTLSPVSRDLCHGVDWVTYVDAWTTEHRNRICKSVVPPASVVEQNRYLNTLTLHYAQRAVRETISANVPDGASRHFFEWMKTLAGDVSQAPVFPKEFAGHDTEPLDEAVLRLGPHLSKILTRETHPLSLLVPDNLLGRLYNSERSNRCTAQIARYCNELGKQKPGLRVLEVGAGTASATLPILQALSGSGIRSVSRYDFTDISPGFFESAKQCLGDLVDVVEFKVLDVERDPKEQGFEPASYDLIIAGNVIHATRRIDPVLANIRSLLKPGGKFVLMEVTQAEPFYNLIFGVFDGWWAGYDDGRRESPLLSQTQWISRLQLAGFSDPEPWFEDHPQTEGGTISVLIASASFDAIHEELPPIHMVTTDSDESEVWITENWIRSIKQKLPNIQISANSLSSPASDGGIALILPDVAKLLCDNVDADYWQKFKNWVLTARAVILVSYGLHKNIDDPSCGLWIGFARSLRLEHPSLRLVTLDLEASETLWLGKLAEVLPALLLNLKLDLSRQISERENEFAEKDGQLFVSRLYPRQKITDFVRRSERQVAPEIVPFLNNNRILTAELGVPGLIDSIRWKDDIEAPILGLDDVKIELHAASINFKDVLIAAGQLEGITEMRNDCSGIVTEVGTNMRERFKPGDRVCAMYSRSYTNYPVVHGDCCHVVPDDMTFEEAASLPIVWTTVYYSLIDMGRLARGEKILIHSAAGAVGQAAIMLAQHIGAEIFVTVGSNGKRDLLHEKYNIPLENIFSSRSSAFYGSIKRITGSYGVDVVLNSLGGEMFRQSCNLVAPFGRFIEIGKKDLMDDALMPMNFLLRNITFALVDLHAIIDSKKSLARRLLQEVVRLAADRLIRPVTITTMPISEIKTAFRQMQAGKHIGKIILSVQEGQEVEAVPPPPTQAKLRSDATFAVVGGFGGVGRAVMAWMAEHGAKHILSISRSGAKDQQSQAFVRDMGAKGVAIVDKNCDVASLDELMSLIQEVERDGLPPIRGVIQSAMVLKDSIFENMTVDQWQQALAPKIRGTMNLHRCFGNDLDFFVTMSSSVAISGNVGQSNYAAACSFQDALARHRAAAGMAAYSINISGVQEVGFVSENPEVVAVSGPRLGCVHISELLSLLNYAITRPPSNDPAESSCAIGLLPKDDAAFTIEKHGRMDKRFAHLFWHDVVSQNEDESVCLLQLLNNVSQLGDAVDIICNAILQQLGKLIATPVEMLNSARDLDSYGVDSLVAVELRNWIGTYLQANVQLMVMRNIASINELAKLVAKESRLVNFEAA